jgi:N4-gp56 family major capsid protein
MSYAPAVNTTQSVGLTQLASVYYEKRGLDKLFAMLRFQAAAESDHQIPQGVGKTMQMWRGTLPGANTTPSAEGVIGVGLPLVTTTLSVSVENYSDFTSTSALLEETAINNMITEASEQMSYRAALSVDNITRAEFDGSGVTIASTIGGAGFLLPDARKQVALLQGSNVLPKSGGANEPGGGDFLGIIHPYSAYDMVADNTAGGFIDISKYTGDNASKLFTGEIGRAAGVRWVTTTNVGSDGVAAPNTKYYVYIVGKGAIGAVPLVGRGPSNVIDPSKSQFKLAITKGGPAGFDPPGEIGTFVAYRFVYAAKCLDSTNFRYAVVKADSSII